MVVIFTVIDKRLKGAKAPKEFATYGAAGDYLVMNYEKVINVTVHHGDFTIPMTKDGFLKSLRRMGYTKEVRK